jgi:hypothetical protein
MSSDSEQTANVDSEDAMKLARRIEYYLKRTKTSATQFGREAVNDPNFVFEMRRGRQLGEPTAERIRAWLDRANRRR